MLDHFKHAAGWVRFMAVLFIFGALFGAASAGLTRGMASELDRMAPITVATSLSSLVSGLALWRYASALQRYASALQRESEASRIAEAHLAFWKLFVAGIALTVLVSVLGFAVELWGGTT